MSITGSIISDGGNSGNSSGVDAGGTGGGGSGGAIRIIATTITGNGTIAARGGAAGGGTVGTTGSKGSIGRIRLEAETMLRTATTNPVYSFSDPKPVFEIKGSASLILDLKKFLTF